MKNFQNSPFVKTKAGEQLQIDKDGSLGLLALGDIGLQLWRQKKIAHHNELEIRKSKVVSSNSSTKES